MRERDRNRSRKAGSAPERARELLAALSQEQMTALGIPLDGISRRRFLALVGASTALAALGTSCSRPDRGEIVSYTRKPRELVPGIANHYASTFQEGLATYGVLVKTREGRPIHIEGNDEHPDFAGKTSLRAVADILRMYDPDRLRQPLVDGLPATWVKAEAKVLTGLDAARNSGRPVALVTGGVPSPSRRTLIEELGRVLPRLIHVSFEPLAPHAERIGALGAFGEASSPRFRFDRADVVVSFQADFLGTDGVAPTAIREFADRRRPTGQNQRMNRLWVFEGGMSLTGANADGRLAIRPSRAADVTFALARALRERHGVSLPPGLTSETLGAFDLDAVAGELGVPAAELHALAADLAGAGKRALILAGPSVPVEAHVGAHLLNVMLGAEGHTVETAFTSLPGSLLTLGEMREHLAEVSSGSFSVVIFWGVNPAYAFPDAALWRSAAASVPLKVFIGLHADETAADCHVVLPEHHWLEAWGDYETSTDLLSLQQPAISPLYDTKQGEDVMLRVIGALGGRTWSDYQEYLKARWQREVFPAASPVPFEQFWNVALHDGVLRREARPRQPRTLRVEAVEASAARAAESAAKGRAATKTALTEGESAVGGFELVLHPGATVYDGRYANNGWLQELPDPVTKATWSNPVSLSPADAKRLDLEEGDMVRIEAGGRAVEVPILVQPGQAAGVITGSLGYGRRALSVAGGVGVSLYPLLDEASSVPGFRPVVTLARTGGRVTLPLAQRHHWLEGRDIVRSYPLGHEAAGEGGHGKEGELPSLYPEQDFPEHKWGMAIDLSACVGCGACIVACQSENNIAVVGPEQVVKGREMHWIRVDRYYEGDPEAPTVLFQPMLCQQCDNAPCENVCPVNATNHTPDGLNQMVYNRCVGTRYCANNCPYKVRRFNFLEFTAGKVEPESLVYNPEVTVRPRGVMEKCTFCVQRIQDARQRAKIEGRAIRDGDITPACAAACPAQAIVFGDLKDPESLVSRLSNDGRGYQVLAELGVRPAVTYLSNITNPAGQGGRHGV